MVQAVEYMGIGVRCLDVGFEPIPYQDKSLVLHGSREGLGGLSSGEAVSAGQRTEYYCAFEMRDSVRRCYVGLSARGKLGG